MPDDDAKIVRLPAPRPADLEALVREARMLILEVDDILDELKTALERTRRGE